MDCFSVHFSITPIETRFPVIFLRNGKLQKTGFLATRIFATNPFVTETDNDLVNHFNCLDGYLYIAASSQYDRLKDLNEILDATNQ